MTNIKISSDRIIELGGVRLKTGDKYMAAPRVRLLFVLGFTIRRERIVRIDVIADPERLRQLELAILSH